MVTKRKKTGTLGDKASDFAKSIWLAGLGAYGQSYNELKKPPKSMKDLPVLFKKLVKKGENIETGQKQKPLSRLKTESGENLEQRIKKFRDTFNFGLPGTNSNRKINEIEQKIDALGRDIAELRQLVLGLAKTPSKRTSTKRKTGARASTSAAPKGKRKMKSSK